MRHNVKKILAAMLAVLMLASMAAATIPAGAEVATPINLAPNEDNWVNGVKIRFETSGADTYAKIEDGKLIVKMIEGDLLWFPELTVKDATSTFSFNITANTGNAIPMIATGIQPKGSETVIYGQGYGKTPRYPLPF